MKTGEKIAKARKDLNLTQDQLAELLDVTRQTISKWECDLSLPETAKIAKLAEVLNVSCDYLLKEEKQTVEVPVKSTENGYVVNWTKLYPILVEYQSTVDCIQYNIRFIYMIKEMMGTYKYSLEDTVLVLKDLQYQAFLQLQKEEKQ